jgi:circadian clock protein KaiC
MQLSRNTDDLHRVGSGIAGLDNILLGGWPSNHLYLLEGPPGTGKTTIALQFLLEGAAQGERVLYVTLSESKHELESVAKSHGLNLENVEILEYSPTEESLNPANEYSALHPAEVEFQDTMQTILQKIEEVRPARLAFDSFSEIRLLARDSLRYRRQVLALKHYFLNRSCTVLMLDEPSSHTHDLNLRSIAHGVLSLERMPRDYGAERRRLRVAKLRGSSFREGFHDYNIVRGGVQAYPRLVANEHHTEWKPRVAKSTLASLDGLWGGGLLFGTSTLITGPAGAGKSTIVTAYAKAAADRGERVALFNFDENVDTLLARASQLSLPLHEHIKSGLIHLRHFNPAEVSPGEFIAELRNEVEERNVRMVAIDTINGFINAMAGEQRLLLQMHEMNTYLNQKGVLSFLVLSQTGFIGPETPSEMDLSYLADNTLLLRYFEAEGQVRKAISVVKMRVGNHEKTIRELRFTSDGFYVGEPLRAFSGILTGLPTYMGSSSGLDGAMNEQLSK